MRPLIRILFIVNVGGGPMLANILPPILAYPSGGLNTPPGVGVVQLASDVG